MEWLSQRFELSRGEKGHNVRPMEGLRGFAVFLVFLVHYVTFIRPWISEPSDLSRFADSVHMIGNTGVDLFFVLSGYLIYGSLISRPQKFPRFMSRRVERIYPAFAVVFVIYILLSMVSPAHNKIPNTGLDETIYLIENFLLLPGLFPIEPMITVAWSLSYEIFFYLAIPLVIVALGLRRWSVAQRAGLFLALALGTTLSFSVVEGHVRLIMFISGILLHEFAGNRAIAAPGSVIGLLALVGGLLAMLLPVAGPGGFALKTGLLFVAFFMVCATCICRPGAWLSRMFSWTPVRWLGNMSYSYYLLHGLALQASFLALAAIVPTAQQGPLFFWGLLPVMFAWTLIPTSALFLLVERPYSLSPHRANERGDQSTRRKVR